MFAIGCLFLLVLPLVGVFIGGMIAGVRGVEWGAAIGFAIALVFCGFSAYALVAASRRSRH